MWYVVKDNVVGGCAMFDNIEDCKTFVIVKRWKHGDKHDSKDFTVYEVKQINFDYDDSVTTDTKS